MPCWQRRDWLGAERATARAIVPGGEGRVACASEPVVHQWGYQRSEPQTGCGQGRVACASEPVVHQWGYLRSEPETRMRARVGWPAKVARWCASRGRNTPELFIRSRQLGPARPGAFAVP